MKRAKPGPNGKSQSHLWLESLDERIVPSRPSWLLTQADLKALFAASIEVHSGKGENHGRSSDSEKQHDYLEKLLKVEKKLSHALDDKVSSTGETLIAVESNHTSGLLSQTGNLVGVLPVVSVTTYSGSYVLNEVAKVVEPAAGSEPVVQYTSVSQVVPVAVVETIVRETQSTDSAVKEAIRPIANGSEKDPAKPIVTPVKEAVRVDEIKPVRDVRIDKIAPVDEKIDHPDRELPPVRPLLPAPTTERSLDALPANRGAIEASTVLVGAQDEAVPPTNRQSAESTFVPDLFLTAGTFVLVGSAPTLATITDNPIISVGDDAGLSTAVQAAGAVTRFVPFDPATLKDSVQQFIDSLQAKNLDGGSSFGWRRIALWTTAVLGGIVSGELVRRKKVMKRSREWLSMTFSKWLTLPIKE